jgi:hypothetical protein
MRLTKRGEFVLGFGVLSLALVIGLGIFGAVSFVKTHHQESYKCHQGVEGWECSIRWVHN